MATILGDMSKVLCLGKQRFIFHRANVQAFLGVIISHIKKIPTKLTMNLRFQQHVAKLFAKFGSTVLFHVLFEVIMIASRLNVTAKA